MIWIFCAMFVASFIFVYWWIQQPGSNTSIMEYDQNKYSQRVFY
jgi:hypothetical protein